LKNKHTRIHTKRDHLTRDQVAFIIDKLERFDMKALTAILYLTGARINEALELRRDNFYMEDDKLCIDIPTLKRDKVVRDVMTFRRTQKFIPDKIPFWRLISMFINDVETDVLFQFTDRWYQIKLKNIGDKYTEHVGGAVWSHLFRHTRLQSNADSGMPITAQMHFSGHKQTKGLEPYLSRSKRHSDLAEQFFDY